MSIEKELKFILTEKEYNSIKQELDTYGKILRHEDYSTYYLDTENNDLIPSIVFRVRVFPDKVIFGIKASILGRKYEENHAQMHIAQEFEENPMIFKSHSEIVNLINTFSLNGFNINDFNHPLPGITEILTDLEIKDKKFFIMGKIDTNRITGTMTPYNIPTELDTSSFYKRICNAKECIYELKAKDYELEIEHEKAEQFISVIEVLFKKYNITKKEKKMKVQRLIEAIQNDN